MKNIYPEVCLALEKDNTYLSKLTLEALQSGDYNIQGIKLREDVFVYEFGGASAVMPTILYDYMSAFIVKKLGYDDVLKGTGLRPLQNLIEKFI